MNEITMNLKAQNKTKTIETEPKFPFLGVQLNVGLNYTPDYSRCSDNAVNVRTDYTTHGCRILVENCRNNNWQKEA
jgi:hypothetical protein